MSECEAQLTPQENVVARRVAAGLSNREIARELYLSVRTVEFHLRNIYVKLGIRSRTQLALEFAASPTTPSVRHTLDAVDGALAGSERWLTSDVELTVGPGRTLYGREAVAHHLRSLGQRGDLFLTLDEGRGVAEWTNGTSAYACSFDVTQRRVGHVRLYRSERADGV